MTTRRLLMVLAVGVAAALAGAWLGSRLLVPYLGSAPVQALAAGTLLPQRRALASFALTDTEGAPFDPAALQGRWTLLAFGYASCPDVCPLLLQSFRDIQHRLADRQLGDAVRFVFISVDPERDDLPRLKEYVGYFNPAFVGATGPHPELQRLTRQLGVMYQKAPAEESALGYLVDHTASMLLIDPQARLTALFSAPHDAAAIAADIAGVVDADRKSLSPPR
jgi:protein SCO1/2